VGPEVGDDRPDRVSGSSRRQRTVPGRTGTAREREPLEVVTGMASSMQGRNRITGDLFRTMPKRRIDNAGDQMSGPSHGERRQAWRMWAFAVRPEHIEWAERSPRNMLTWEHTFDTLRAGKW
jgi:hypothetical protein